LRNFQPLGDGVSRRKGSNNRAKAEFLAALPELREALAKGQSVTAFYLENKDRLGLSFGYSWFCHLMRAFNIRAEVEEAQLSLARLPRQALPARIQASPAANRHPPSTAPPRDRAQPPPSSQPTDFHYDPADAYKTKFD
jgi:hypothetical protein